MSTVRVYALRFVWVAQSPFVLIQVAAVVSVLCELARKNPGNYVKLAPTLFNLLTTGAPHAWLQLKVSMMERGGRRGERGTQKIIKSKTARQTVCSALSGGASLAKALGRAADEHYQHHARHVPALRVHQHV